MPSKNIFTAFLEGGIDHPLVKKRVNKAAREVGRAKATKVTIDRRLKPNGIRVVENADSYYTDISGKIIPVIGRPRQGLRYNPVVCHVAISPIIHKD